MSEAVVKFGGSLLHQPRASLLSSDGLPIKSMPESFSSSVEANASNRCDNSIVSILSTQRKMHWRCIRLLDATFEIVSELLPQCRTVESVGEFQSCCLRDRNTVAHDGAPEVFLVRIGSYYEANDALSQLLPANWETTSDALAFLLAKKLGIQELILLKSCDTT